MSIILNGSAGVTTNSGAVYDGISRGTAVTASGTFVDFTSIPSWVKRITVMLSGVSLSGTDSIIVQLGTSGGIVSTGYTTASTTTGGTTTTAITSGFPAAANSAGADSYTGILTIVNITGNVWVENASLSQINSGSGRISAGVVTLSGLATTVRLTSTGTNTFDAGTINILFE
jgi:hypothetical protein